MIERHEAEAFLALAEELHFGRAAERLHVSTTRVSQVIRKLERTVGVPLFRRTSRRVELTAVGAQLRAELEPAWTAVGSALRHAIETGRGLTGSLSVGFASVAAAQILVEASELFRERAPECTVHIKEASPSQLLPRLQSGDIDLALDTVPVMDPGVAHGPVLIRESLVLAVPAGHPFARRESISVDDLDRVQLVPFADHHTAPSFEAPTAVTLHEALTLVASGYGALPLGAHTRRYYARPDIEYVPIRDAAPVEWGLLWPAERRTARVAAFSDAVELVVAGES